MSTGWIEENGDHYYLGEDGKWQEDKTWPEFNQREKEIWKEYIIADYTASFSTNKDGNYDIETFSAILLTGDVFGSEFLKDGDKYYVPETSMKEILMNLLGESLYTSEEYIWPWDKINGNYVIYKGDFGAEIPFVKIRNIEEIYSGVLELTGEVGSRSIDNNAIISSSSFTLRLIPSDIRTYSSYKVIMFIY